MHMMAVCVCRYPLGMTGVYGGYDRTCWGYGGGIWWVWWEYEGVGTQSMVCVKIVGVVVVGLAN